eukprot:12418729-Ditylum_brightwellii.AAC.1
MAGSASLISALPRFEAIALTIFLPVPNFSQRAVAKHFAGAIMAVSEHKTGGEMHKELISLADVTSYWGS